MSLARLGLVPTAIGMSLGILCIVVRNAPGEEESLLYFPSSLEDIRSLAAVLGEYNELHPKYVLTLFSSAYLFKQTFAVPGSVFLNVLAGAIFGSTLGFILCCFLTACGASLCYLLARCVGEEPVSLWFPQRLEQFRAKLEQNRAQLPFFLLFLRLFPMSPNWALNMLSGVIGVPLHLFFLSVLVGLMPYNYLCVTSGAILSEISDLGDIVSWGNMARCATAALAALLPTLMLKWKESHKKVEKQEVIEREVEVEVFQEGELEEDGEDQTISEIQS